MDSPRSRTGAGVPAMATATAMATVKVPVRTAGTTKGAMRRVVPRDTTRRRSASTRSSSGSRDVLFDLVNLNSGSSTCYSIL